MIKIFRIGHFFNHMASVGMANKKPFSFKANGLAKKQITTKQHPHYPSYFLATSCIAYPTSHVF